jgi:hypothetical protein
MKLHVVTCVSNPIRFQSRYRLYRDFAKHMHDSGALLHTVECAFGERPFEVTEANNPFHLQVRTDSEVWHKENLLNLMIARLPSDWQYVAWIDADVHFVRPDWPAETVQQLQHYDIVQLFSEAHDLGPDQHVFARYRSFAWSHGQGIPRLRGAGYYGGTPARRDEGIAYYHHSGYAWAIRREAFDAVGGLLDCAVVGEADWIMARSILGEAEETLYPGISAGYRRAILAWQERAVTHLRRNLGCVPGTLLHYWHGPKAGRNYWNRCRLLAQSQFDPQAHLKRDWQGLYQLVDRGDERSLLLRDGLRRYFRSRNEDATTL